MPMRYDVITFDLDGTLVDTASEIAEAANRALESHGIARQPVAEITTLIGAGTRELMLRLLARVMLAEPTLADRVRPEQMLVSMDAHYEATTGTSGQPYPGVHEALARLREAGLKLACVTNKEIRHARRVLAVHHLDAAFDWVVGGDSLPVKKPDAGVLRQVLERLGGEPARAAHVGDSRIDVEAARNAGVAAWAVPYGYNGGEPIAAARPERIFDSLAEIAAHVLAGRSAASHPHGFLPAVQNLGTLPAFEILQRRVEP